MKSKDSRQGHKKLAPSRSSWSQALPRASVEVDFYVDLQNTLIRSLIGDWAPCLENMADLPALIELYEAAAVSIREVDIDLYFRYHQVSCFLKKLELPLFQETGEAVAMEKWLSAEASCKEKNAELWEIKTHPLTHSHDELAHSLEVVRREIYSLLGDFPPTLAEVVGFMKFGPGASLSHSREEGAGVFKLLNSSQYDWLEDEVSFLANHTLFRDLFFEANPLLACVFTTYTEDKPGVQRCVSANYQTVPKSIAEVRSIEIGPSLATFIQQGYDGFLRTRLREWGIDLRYQEPNKVLARLGSELGEKPNSPCTIDLSSASDRIPFGLVASLLPPAWVRTLSRYRAKSVRLPDGTLFSLEKFSSMGNAITFSLQTLIFSAVVRSVLRERGWEGSKWRVYGDDIIVPFRIFDDVVSRLTSFGFKINEKKSFSHGYFRESCGGDYLHGMPVRPFYLKKPFGSIPDVVRFLNLWNSFAISAPIPAGDLGSVYQHVLSLIPRHLRVFGGTDNDPSSCIWTPFGPVSPYRYVEKSYETKVPDKLAYMSRLLTGYTPPFKSATLYNGGFLPPGVALRRLGWGGRMEVLSSGIGSPIEPHSAATAPLGSRGFFLRKTPIRGFVAPAVQRERLPFNAMLK